MKANYLWMRLYFFFIFTILPVDNTSHNIQYPAGLAHNSSKIHSDNLRSYRSGDKVLVC